MSKKENGFIEVSNKEYRAMEGLSSSDIKRMMKSFATWKYYKDHPEEDSDTPSLKFGRASHKYVLEPYDFDNEFAVAPKVDRRTKEGKEAFSRFEKEAEGKDIIDEELYEKLTDMREVLYRTPFVKKLLQGEHEKSFFWVDAETGIKCKFRPDSFGKFGSQNIIVDYKTVECAETSAFMRSALKFNYDVQAAHYLEGMKAITGEDYLFVFVAQEKTKPYLVNVLQADEYFIQNGVEVRNEMLRTYKKCLEKDEWIGYMGFSEEQNFFNTLTCPAWIRNAMDSEGFEIDEG